MNLHVLNDKAPAVLAVVWRKLAAWAAALWKSVVALTKSPAVWLACGLVFVAGYSTAHAIRGHTIARLKQDRDRLLIAARALDAKVQEVEAALAVTRHELAEIKAKAEAVKALPPAPPVTKVKKERK